MIVIEREPGTPPPVETKIVSGAALASFDFAFVLKPNKRYEVVITMPNDDVATATYALRLNGLDVIGDTQTFFSSSAAETSARSTDAVMGVAATGVPTTITIEIPSIKSVSRNIRAVMDEPINGTPQMRKRWTTITPTTPSLVTPLTSVGIKSSVPAGIGITAELNLYELN